MIDWNEVEKDIGSLAYIAKHGVGTTEYHTARILNYVKSLIAKEFELVAKGKVILDNSGSHMGKTYFNQLYDTIFIKKKGKNISIYISENDNKD